MPSAGCCWQRAGSSRSRLSGQICARVALVDEYLAWLTDCERSPNAVEAYAHNLRAFWTFLAGLERGHAGA
jgi:hypothetical protein